MNEKNELHNRDLHISGLLNEKKVDIGSGKVDIQDKKQTLKVHFRKNGKISLLKPQLISVECLKNLDMMKYLAEVQLLNCWV